MESKKDRKENKKRIGEKDKDGNVNNNVIRFILKIGTEYKFNNLSFVPSKKTRNN